MVGFSLGSAVALIGVAHWAAACVAKGWTVQQIVGTLPRVILVAPALRPPRRLWRDYLGKFPDADASENPPISAIFPTCLFELCAFPWPESRALRTDIVEAFSVLQRLGIGVYVALWAHDRLCPPRWPVEIMAVARSGSVRRRLRPLGLRLPVDDRLLVLEHIKFLSRDETVFAVDTWVREPFQA